MENVWGWATCLPKQFTVTQNIAVKQNLTLVWSFVCMMREKSRFKRTLGLKYYYGIFGEKQTAIKFIDLFNIFHVFLQQH